LLHLKGAEHSNVMWQHAPIQGDDTLNKFMEKIYQHLHNKINKITNITQVAHKQTNQSIYLMNTQPKIINLIQKKLKIVEMNFLNLRPLYTMEIKPNRHINTVIIGTENAIRQIKTKGKVHIDI